MSEHHVRWSSFQRWTSLCWSYLLYDSRSTFRSQCSEAIYAYARLVKFNPSILHVQSGLHPLYVNVELITPDHHVVSRHDELSQWCILRENTYTFIFSERSPYNATDELSKIRCIKDKHHMQSKYVTWYGHDHLAPLISISKVLSWPPSSPAWHHDLHHLDLYQCVVTWSSRQLLLLQLLLSHRDKVKQLFGACILCNRETTIRLLPVADNFNK